jgi:hypothetical protein
MHSPTLRRVPLVGPNLHSLGLAVNISDTILFSLIGSVITLWH